MATYKELHSAERRADMSQRALEVGKIPIICERRRGCTLPEMSNKKFVVAPSMSVGMFVKVLTERVAVEVAERIFLFVGDSLLTAQKISVGDLYRAKKDRDGFIYVTYSNDRSGAARQIGAYHSTHTESELQTESGRILAAGKLPILVEKEAASALPDLRDNNFFVSPDLLLTTFLQLVGARVALEVGRGVHLYAGNHALVRGDTPMRDAYAAFKGDDGFMLVTYTEEAPQPSTPRYPRGAAGAMPPTPPSRRSSAAPASANASARSLPSVGNAAATPPRPTPCPVSRRPMGVAMSGSGSGTAPPLPAVARPPPTPPAAAKKGGASPRKNGSATPRRASVPYTEEHPEAERRAAAAEALAAGKIPFICERRDGSPLADLANKKFIVAPSMPVGRFHALLRERVSSEVAGEVYLFVGADLLTAKSVTAAQLYAANKSADGLMYVTYDCVAGHARHMGTYKSTHTAKHRISEARRALALGKTPVIVEPAAPAAAAEIEQKKFWVPFAMTVRDFTDLLRTRIAAETSEKVVLFVDGRPADPRQHKTMDSFYRAYKDDDGFVYVTYAKHIAPR